MIRLRIILKSKYFILFLLFLFLFRISLNKNKSSIFNIDDSNFTCIVTNINGNKYLLDCGEFIETKIDDNSIKIGDVLNINGKLSLYNSNTNFNIFDYKEYQENKNIYFYLNTKTYEKIKISNNIILNIKRFIYDRIYNLKSFNYLNAFILGNKSEIDTDSLKKIGIIHLFSISGMHITFLLSLIDKYIDKGKVKKYLTEIISTILLYFFIY